MTDNELRDKLASEHSININPSDTCEAFIAGWDAARENPLFDEKRIWDENELLRDQNKIAVEALKNIKHKSLQGDETSIELTCHIWAREALEKIKGEK